MAGERRRLAEGGLVIGRRVVTTAWLLATFGAEAAEPVRVLSGGALEPAVAAALAVWRSGNGAEVAVTFATAPRIAERLAAGERPELVLAPRPALEELERAGQLASPPRPLGSVGVGIALRDGAPVPDLRDETSLRAALLAAEAVVFNRASTGLYVERLLERMGLAEAVAAKAVRFPDGDAVLERIGSGSGREIAFAAITEILLWRDRGVRLAGPLPAAVQNRTTYVAALLGDASPEARRFLAFLEDVPTRAAMAAAGVE
ncbi:substrate-binding domain-containing protein [Roseomonas sp. BN140053]|uniref:substrate-binding domain-containing protein n=1 Tax=Roseomonas sp. BN140053 TaxID=3391898 RepID=UPI0039EB5A8B